METSRRRRSVRKSRNRQNAVKKSRRSHGLHLLSKAKRFERLKPQIHHSCLPMHCSLTFDSTGSCHTLCTSPGPHCILQNQGRYAICPPERHRLRSVHNLTQRPLIGIGTELIQDLKKILSFRANSLVVLVYALQLTYLSQHNTLRVPLTPNSANPDPFLYVSSL